MTTPRRSLVVMPAAGGDPAIVRWLWALDDARQRTLTQLADFPPTYLDWIPPAGENSIGTLLYHIAAIEADWLSAEVREEVPFAPDLAALFPYDVRETTGRLSVVAGLTLAEHLARLATTRAELSRTFRALSLSDFRRVRTLPDYDVTPEWVLHHLMQHEAGHRGEMGLIAALAAQAGATRTIAYRAGADSPTPTPSQ